MNQFSLSLFYFYRSFCILRITLLYNVIIKLEEECELISVKIPLNSIILFSTSLTQGCVYESEQVLLLNSLNLRL